MDWQEPDWQERPIAPGYYWCWLQGLTAANTRMEPKLMVVEYQPDGPLPFHSFHLPGSNIPLRLSAFLPKWLRISSPEEVVDVMIPFDVKL